VQGCEIWIDPLFYYTKFRKELEFKVHCGFPRWLSLLEKKREVLTKQQNTREKNSKMRKKRNEKKNPKKVESG